MESTDRYRLGDEKTPGRVPVSGDSMLPSLRAGDEVDFERVSGLVQPGDVIVFKMASGLCVHRVIQVDNEKIQTRGDNCPLPDPAISRTAILGKVISVSRGGRLLQSSEWMNAPSRLQKAWVKAQRWSRRLRQIARSAFSLRR